MKERCRAWENRELLSEQEDELTYVKAENLKTYEKLRVSYKDAKEMVVKGGLGKLMRNLYCSVTGKLFSIWKPQHSRKEFNLGLVTGNSGIYSEFQNSICICGDESGI
jgi:hypothetical protein